MFLINLNTATSFDELWNFSDILLEKLEISVYIEKELPWQCIFMIFMSSWLGVCINKIEEEKKVYSGSLELLSFRVYVVEMKFYKFPLLLTNYL